MERIKRDYVEYGVVEHCNLKCDGCSVFAPHLKPFFTELDNYKRDVLELAKHIRVRRFRLLGGEPMLHKQIVDFINIARQSGIGDKVGICSNGELAPKMSDDFYKAIQFLDISVYPDSRIDYVEIGNFLREKQKQFGFKLRIMGHKKQFQIMNLDTELTDKDQIQKIYDTCEIAHGWSCHHFYDGYYYLCAKSVYQNKYFDRRGIKTDIDYRKDDGISIHDPDFGARLTARLQDKTPPKACAFCLGTNGPKFPNRQLTKEEIESQVVK